MRQVVVASAFAVQLHVSHLNDPSFFLAVYLIVVGAAASLINTGGQVVYQIPCDVNPLPRLFGELHVRLQVETSCIWAAFDCIHQISHWGLLLELSSESSVAILLGNPGIHLSKFVICANRHFLSDGLEPTGLLNDGRVVFAPSDATYVGVFDPADDSFTTVVAHD